MQHFLATLARFLYICRKIETMSKKIILTLVMAVFMTATATCKVKNYVPERGDYTFKTQVCATTDEEEGWTLADSVITTVTDKMGNSFTLVSLTQPLDTVFWREFGEIREDDINFDSIPDLMICLGPTNSFGGFTYDGYVWNQTEHKFVRVEKFDEIMDPTFYPDKNQIVGTFRIDNHCWTSLYEWKNGKLVLISEDEFELDMEY